MGWKVVYHHDVAALERRCQALLDIGHEGCPVDWPVENHRCHHLVMSQSRYERDRLPFSLRNMADQSLATRATSSETDHIDAGRSLIDKHQSRRIKKALLPNPTAPRSRYVRSMLLGCPQAFFERDAMTIEESPERAAAARNPSLVHRRYKLVQRSVRPLINQGKDALGIVFQDRSATTARFRCTHPMITPTLQPSYCRTGTDLKALGRFTSRRSLFHCFDNSLTQVTRQRFRHPGSPHRRINAIDSLTQTA